jgi:guanine deaminase
MNKRLIRGQLVSFTDETVKHCQAGAVVIDAAGKIQFAGDASQLSASDKLLPCDNCGSKLLMPGFIDPHIHFPQYRMLAAPGVDLLDWLRRFTFPEESRYGDMAHAEAAAEIFLDRLLRHGTTSALAFCSVHRTSADALFAAAEKRGMAMATGKTLMDRNAIPAVQDNPESAALESEALYGRWHNRGRLRHVVSPRFAITSSEAQLKVAGELLRELKGSLMQTHLSESPGEIAMVRQLFPTARDYTDVYDHFGLLGPHSLFAHGIHLSERECARLSETGSTIIHCPTSNLFLGSGLMSMAMLAETARPVGFGLATDIGGGTSYSMLRTMGEAYKVQMLLGYKPSAVDLFRLATLGNAQRLHQQDEIGSLETGKFADVIVLDPQATPELSARHDLSESLEDMLFALMILGDERAVAATYVAGHKVFGAAPA